MTATFCSECGNEYAGTEAIAHFLRHIFEEMKARNERDAAIAEQAIALAKRGQEYVEQFEEELHR